MARVTLYYPTYRKLNRLLYNFGNLNALLLLEFQKFFAVSNGAGWTVRTKSASISIQGVILLIKSACEGEKVDVEYRFPKLYIFMFHERPSK